MSPTHRSSLPSRKGSYYSFLLEDEPTPGHRAAGRIVKLCNYIIKGLGSLCYLLCVWSTGYSVVLFIVRVRYWVLRCVIYYACGVPGTPLCYVLCVWSTG